MAIYPAIAFILIVLTMPVFIRLAHRFNLFDEPDEDRKRHNERIPYTGGFSIITAFSITALVMWFQDGLGMIPDQPTNFVPLYLYTVEAAGVIFLLGLIDDFRQLSFTKKFLFQFFAAMLIILGATKSNLYPSVFGTMESGVILNSLGTLISLFWIVGATNAINMIDGMDGLAGGSALISAVSMGFIAFWWGSSLLGILLLILAATLVGFLIYNKPPAKVFMGDTGSMFLGFALAISGWVLVDSAPTKFTNFFVPVVILGLPVSDTLLAFFRRIVTGRNPFSADTFHIHHMLKKRYGLTTRTTVLILYGITAVYCLFGIATAFVPVLAGCILLAVLVLANFLFLHKVGYTKLLRQSRARTSPDQTYIVDDESLMSDAYSKKNGNGTHASGDFRESFPSSSRKK